MRIYPLKVIIIRTHFESAKGVQLYGIFRHKETESTKRFNTKPLYYKLEIQELGKGIRPPKDGKNPKPNLIWDLYIPLDEPIELEVGQMLVLNNPKLKQSAYRNEKTKQVIKIYSLWCEWNAIDVLEIMEVEE